MTTEQTVDQISTKIPDFKPGPYLAKVISLLEPSYMGVLEVKLLRPVGNGESADQLFPVRYMSPFWGQTSVDYAGKDPNDYDNTQKSYGMWMVPPDVGTTVVVIFIEGSPKNGFWIGCVPDEGMNFMVPGLPATRYAVGESNRVPVAEYNKAANSQVTDVTKVLKPKHPLAQVLEDQGLIKDDIRGITTSGARREVPSMVFGISTPGPIDKKPGAKKGQVGKEGKKVNAFVSRLGGTTFVMDDGDDKFLRKKTASEGPPEYAPAGEGDTSGKPDIPHNELVRIRTRTGHQILLHNSEDLIYIGNARGTTWVELTSDGKIDIYAQDSISVHTENDLNFTAGRDINFNAGANINLNAATSLFATAGSNIEIKAGADGKLTAVGSLNFNSSHHIETAGTIDMNGPGAATATAAKVPGRVPQTEPWNGHENLDPMSFKPAQTAAVESAADGAAPEYFQKYTTPTDPFEHVKPAEG